MRLTTSEQIFIARRRAGRSQVEQAARLGVTLGHYIRAEAGLEQPGFRMHRITKLAPHERCVIMRRRSGETQATIARRVGYCRRWVQLMEMGEVDPSPLVKYHRT